MQNIFVNTLEVTRPFLSLVKLGCEKLASFMLMDSEEWKGYNLTHKMSLHIPEGGESVFLCVGVDMADKVWVSHCKSETEYHRYLNIEKGLFNCYPMKRTLRGLNIA